MISFLPADGPEFGNTVCDSPHLAGLNFTGSVPTFKVPFLSVPHFVVHFFTELNIFFSICGDASLAILTVTLRFHELSAVIVKPDNFMHIIHVLECGGKNFHFAHPSGKDTTYAFLV